MLQALIGTVFRLSGRDNRLKFRDRVLGGALVLLAGLVLAQATQLIGPLVTLLGIALMAIAAIRRLQDLNVSPAWVLPFAFLPFSILVPAVFLLICALLILPGTSGANRFGPEPVPLERSGLWR